MQNQAGLPKRIAVADPNPRKHKSNDMRGQFQQPCKIGLAGQFQARIIAECGNNRLVVLGNLVHVGNQIQTIENCNRKVIMGPTSLTVRKDRKSLEIAFGDEEIYELSAEILRVLSPSAEVQGHSPEQRKTIGGKRDVGIMSMEPVGNYAVRITFDDMHDTGIFTWAYFRELGQNLEARWAEYLTELEDKGMSREPAAPSRTIP